jgi:Dolichyl-phosphate-mannose-protein mannosyltransferase
VSSAAIERYAWRQAPAVAPALGLAGLTTALFLRLLPDVSGKPLHEDEAVAGLVSARPLGDLLHTVVLDRGGAPLHFVLAHMALAVDPSADALRWLSVVFALATVPLCYDLARRLAGRFAGLTAATLAATSQLLTVYGTFGRMYSLFACASALSADLFVRALARPARRSALVAAAAALLPLAVHPFGAFLFAAEVAVTLCLWRGRELRAALPVLAVAALALPMLLADLRLSDRYAPEVGQDLDGGSSAGSAGLHALGGAAGGYGAILAIFVTLAAIGAFALGRRRPAFAAFACIAVTAPPVALALADAAGLVSDRLGPRHLVFMLPIWIALVAAGVTRLADAIPLPRLAILVTVGVAAALAPSAIAEPRSIATGEESAVAAPAAWLRAHIAPGDALYPYSPVFLAALPEAAEAHAYPREAVALARAARRTADIPAVFVSLPLRAPVTTSTVEDLKRAGVDAHAFRSWLILEQRGPFADGRAALSAAAASLEQAESIIAVEAPSANGYLQQIHGAACAALIRLDYRC